MGLTFVALFIDVLGLDQPVHVADHVLLHLFALLRLLELTAGHGLLSFLGELSVKEHRVTVSTEKSSDTTLSCCVDHKIVRGGVADTNPLNTPNTRLMMKKEPKMTRDTK